MVSAVDRAISAARRMQVGVRGVDVTYVRSGAFSLAITGAVQGQSTWRGMGAGGSVVISQSVDWLLPVDQLVDANGAAIEPARGDTVDVTIGGIDYTYSVQPFGNDELLYRWVDRGGRSVVRVFCKLWNREASA